MHQQKFEDLIPKRNQAAHQRHRREVFWQVSFPLGLGSLLLLVTCGLTVAAASGGSSTSLWRDVSLIWLITPAMLLSLVPLALLAAAVVGLYKLTAALPPFFYRLQRFFEAAAARTAQACTRLASPVIGIRSWSAALDRLRRSLR